MTHLNDMQERVEFLSVVKRNQVIYEAKILFICYVNTGTFIVMVSAVTYIYK